MINKSIIFSFLLMASTLFLGSCGPTYTTHNEYVPPSTPQALSCLRQCNAKLNACQNSCDTRKQSCLLKAKHMANISLPIQEKEYVNKLELYIAEKKHYDLEKRERHHQLSRLEMDYDVYSNRCKKDAYYCTRQNEVKRELRDLKYAATTKAPAHPTKPTLASETQRHQANCTSDCSCKPRYNSCYTSCGGQIVPHQICTHNCPQKK
jgi:hypothetical protein